MGVKFTNNAATTLSSGISSGATSFTVAAATDFPTLGVGDWTYVSLTNEVVKVTAISGGTFTCVATSGAHSAGVSVELRMTSELLNDFAEDTESLLLAGGTMTGTTAHGDNVKATYGASADLQIYHDGSHSYIEDVGTGDLTIRASNDLRLEALSTKAYLTCNENAEVQIYYNNALKLQTASSGIDVTGNVVVSGTVDGRDVATDGTKLDNIETSATADQTNAEIKTAVQAATSISLGGSPTTTTQAESDDSTKIATTAYVTDKITTLIGGAPSTLNDLNELANAINDDANYNSTLTTALGTKLPLTGGTMTGSVYFNDGVVAKFGTHSDLQIYHNGSNSYINEAGDGDLLIKSQGTNVKIISDGDEDIARFTKDGGAQLYYNNSKKIETSSAGIDVLGNIAVTGTVDGVDIQTLNTTAGAALPKAGGTMTGTISGFTSTGITDNATSVAMTIDSSENIDLAGDLGWEDGKKATFGGSSDLQIWHDGSDSVIQDQGTGNLKLCSDNLYLRNAADTETTLRATENGSLKLYYDNAEKLATSSEGIDVTGEVKVSYGSGASPSYTFTGDTDTGMFRSAANTLSFSTGSLERWRLENDGDVHADGDIIAYSTTVSDERLKENIQPIEDALSKVNQLKGCTFTYTADGKESAGLIAQDVEKVLPSAVSEKELPLKVDDGEKYKVLQYDQTIGLLVEAIKELSAKVEELEGK